MNQAAYKESLTALSRELYGSDGPPQVDQPSRAIGLASRVARASKQRDYRRRKRQGIRVYRVPLSAETIDKLVEAGELTPEAASDCEFVGRAVAKIVTGNAFHYANDASKFSECKQANGNDEDTGSGDE